MATVAHTKTNNIDPWTQPDLDAQIALGNFPPGTTINDIVLSTDYNGTGAHVLTLGADENFVTDAQLALIDTALQPGDVAWGTITGTLSDQTDLQTALDGKVAINQASGTLDSSIIHDTAGTIQLSSENTSFDSHMALTLTSGEVFYTGRSGDFFNSTYLFTAFVYNVELTNTFGSGIKIAMDNSNGYVITAHDSTYSSQLTFRKDAYDMYISDGSITNNIHVSTSGITMSAYQATTISNVTTTNTLILDAASDDSGAEILLMTFGGSTVNYVTGGGDIWTKGNFFFGSTASTIDLANSTSSLNILTSATQKLGFFSATAVARQTGDVATALENFGLMENATISPVLATTTGINAKTVANTLAYTVPAGKTAVITAVTVRCTAASSITIGPTCSVGTTSGGTDLFSSTAITTLTATPKLYEFTLVGMSVTVAAAGTVYFNITAGATGTSQSVAVDVIGYLI